MGTDMVRVGTRADGGWVWDGARWVCDPDCDPCPPGFQPPIVTPAFFPPPVFSGPTAQPPWYPGANGGVSFGSVAPPNPVRGHFWWNGTILQMWDGAAWVTIGGGTTGGGGGSGSTGAGTVIISTTAPGNPQVGAQWWDGSQLRVWDGAQWNIIGPGAAAGPVPTTTETFRMVNLTALSVPSGDVWGIVPFTGAPNFDTQSAWDGVTKKLTPKKAGVYMFSIRGLGGGACGIVLTRNDQGVLDVNTTPMIAEQFTTAGGAVSTEAISVMNGTTDFVRMWATSDTGTMEVLGGGLPMFQAYLLP